MAGDFYQVPTDRLSVFDEVSPRVTGEGGSPILIRDEANSVPNLHLPDRSTSGSRFFAKTVLNSEDLGPSSSMSGQPFPKESGPDPAKPESTGFIKPVFEDRVISFRKSALEVQKVEENRSRNHTYLPKFPSSPPKAKDPPSKPEPPTLNPNSEDLSHSGEGRPASKTTSGLPETSQEGGRSQLLQAKQRSSHNSSASSQTKPFHRKLSPPVAHPQPKASDSRDPNSSNGTRNDSIFGLDSYARISHLMNIPLNPAAPSEGPTANITIQDLQGDPIAVQRYSQPLQAINEFIVGNQLGSQTECVVYLPDKSEFMWLSRQQSGHELSFEQQFHKFRLSRMSDFSIQEVSGVRRISSKVRRSSPKPPAIEGGVNRDSTAKPIDLETVVELPAEFPGEKNVFQVTPVPPATDDVESYVIKSELTRHQVH